jgi:hypothetical protein
MELDKAKKLIKLVDEYDAELDTKIEIEEDTIKKLQKFKSVVEKDFVTKDVTDYFSTLLISIDSEIYHHDRWKKNYMKYKDCEHDNVDTTWDGHDSHKDYYKVSCNDCGAVFSSYSI